MFSFPSSRCIEASHPFVDDAVTCDSCEANWAWSSMPAETPACLPPSDGPNLLHPVTQPAKKKKKSYFFPFCGHSSALRSCSADSEPRTAARGQGQRRVTCQHHLLWTVNHKMTESGRNGGFRNDSTYNERPTAPVTSKEALAGGYCPVCKIIHLVIEYHVGAGRFYILVAENAVTAKI